MPLTLHRANFLMQAVLVPAGEHRIVFSYEPVDFRVGAACERRVREAQCTVKGCPGHTGQISFAALSQTLNTKSSDGSWVNSSQLLLCGC